MKGHNDNVVIERTKNCTRACWIGRFRNVLLLLMSFLLQKVDNQE